MSLQLLIFPELKPATLGDIVYNNKPINFENIKHFKNIELDVVSKLMGIPLYGTKAKKIYHILDLWDLRQTLAGFDSSYEGAKKLSDQYRRVELHDMCRRVKIWKSGNKVQLAIVLL